MTTPKAVPADLIDELLANYKKPEDLVGENGLLKQLTKRLVERTLRPSWPNTWATTSMPRWRTWREARATARAGKRSRANLATYPSRFPATGTAPSSRS